MSDFNRTDICKPDEGEVVEIFFPEDEMGPECWLIAEYHHVPAKHELNRHVWHAPGIPRDDYSSPPFWRRLTKPSPDQLSGLFSEQDAARFKALRA
jgi:hypothetical protein